MRSPPRDVCQDISLTHDHKPHVTSNGLKYSLEMHIDYGSNGLTNSILKQDELLVNQN